MKKYIPLFFMFFFVNDAQADQTGDCTAGSQYCEQNSMTTTSTTTTTTTYCDDRCSTIVQCGPLFSGQWLPKWGPRSPKLGPNLPKSSPKSPKCGPNLHKSRSPVRIWGHMSLLLDRALEEPMGPTEQSCQPQHVAYCTPRSRTREALMTQTRSKLLLA